ncbi:MAG: formylglycine-generating enzyme family protein [Planctomycetaceae bacterium]
MQRGDFTFETSKLVLKNGVRITVHVELLAGEVQVRQGEALIGQKKLPGSPVAATEPEPWHGWLADAPPPAIAPFNSQQARQYQEAWAKHLGVPVEYENSLRMKFVLIPPGEFTMGSPEQEVDEALKVIIPFWHNNVRSQVPQHKVILTKPFYLAVHEVTQGHFEKLLSRNPSVFSAQGEGKAIVAGMNTSNHPAEMASWHDAAEFCLTLSERENHEPAYVRHADKMKPIAGAGYQLPSEALWEFACRAGTTTRFWSGDDDKDIAKVGWWMANSESRTHPVGELSANPFGLYDIHGNVSEWVQDWGRTNYYEESRNKPAIDPLGAAMEDDGSSGRLYRGGAWYGGESRPVMSYVWSRQAQVPIARSGAIGFRIALTVEAVKAATAK